MKPSGSRALLVKQPGSALAEVIEQSLGAAGVRVTAAATPYDALVEAHRGPPFRYLIVGVDHFGRDEFHLLPLARRQWPDATLVAYHSPGFEYKGQLAELVGADLIIGNLDGVSALLEGLGQCPEPAAGPEPAGVRPAAPEGPLAAPLAGARPSKTAEAPADLSGAARRAKPEPSATPRAASDRDDLTEEELRLLLSEEEPA
jgi:hypothetical protein